VRANGGTDLVTGQPVPGEVQLDPVVAVAMQQLSQMVNHANGLVQTEDKELAIQTLQGLFRAGYRFDVDDLVAFALANGFTGSEAERLRDYATKVVAGHRFRPKMGSILRDDIVEQWERDVQQADAK